MPKLLHLEIVDGTEQWTQYSTVSDEHLTKPMTTWAMQAQLIAWGVDAVDAIKRMLCVREMYHEGRRENGAGLTYGRGGCDGPAIG
jgi:hypothetical protein